MNERLTEEELNNIEKNAEDYQHFSKPSMVKTLKAMVYTIKSIKAERDRYREALKKVVEQCDYNNCYWCGNTVKDIAQSALKEETK